MLTAWAASVIFVVGAVFVVYGASKPWVAQSRRWWSTVVFCAVLSGSANTIWALAIGGGSPLIRDVVFIGAVGVLSSLVAGLVAWQFRGQSPTVRVIVTTAVVVVMAVATPIGMLMVHCTSGDCI